MIIRHLISSLVAHTYAIVLQYPAKGFPRSIHSFPDALSLACSPACLLAWALPACLLPHNTRHDGLRPPTPAHRHRNTYATVVATTLFSTTTTNQQRRQHPRSSIPALSPYSHTAHIATRTTHHHHHQPLSEPACARVSRRPRHRPTEQARLFESARPESLRATPRLHSFISPSAYYHVKGPPAHARLARSSRSSSRQPW